LVFLFLFLSLFSPIHQIIMDGSGGGGDGKPAKKGILSSSPYVRITYYFSQVTHYYLYSTAFFLFIFDSSLHIRLDRTHLPTSARTQQ